MLPDGAHLRSEDWTVFYLGQTASSAVAPMLAHEHSPVASSFKDKRASALPLHERPKRGVAGGGLLYVLNCVRMKEDKTVRRGAMVKALAVATPHPYIGVYKVSGQLLYSEPRLDVRSLFYSSRSKSISSIQASRS